MNIEELEAKEEIVLEVEELEDKVAPGISVNHNETIIDDGRDAELSGDDHGVREHAAGIEDDRAGQAQRERCGASAGRAEQHVARLDGVDVSMRCDDARGADV